MFGGRRHSFREHFAEGRAAVASWQVDFEKGLTKEICGKGRVLIPQSSFHHVQLKFCGLVKRKVALDNLCGLMHQLEQLDVYD